MSPAASLLRSIALSTCACAALAVVWLLASGDWPPWLAFFTAGVFINAWDRLFARPRAR